MLVPVWPTKKHAMVAHRGNSFTVEDSRAWFADPKNLAKLRVGRVRVGLLLSELIILDFDDMEQFEKIQTL